MKRNKSKNLIEAEQYMEKLLKRVGYTGKYKGISVNEIPSYKIEIRHKTSDIVCSSAPKKEQSIYSGEELIGIAVSHKSNLLPISNKEDAIAVSNMRR